MTGPVEPDPGAAADAGDRSLAALNAYVSEHAGKYTDEAIRDALVKAGYPPEDVRTALANAGSHLVFQSAAPRAVRTILMAYVAVFALLSAGMLVNGRPAGYLMPNAAGGIGILAGTMVFAFVVSLIWVASRRVFAILVALAIGGFAALGLGPGVRINAFNVVPIVLAVVVVIFVLRLPRTAGARPETLGVLLAVPIILLVGVAGACLATGMPIPGM
jgi:hypothetical protein